MRTNSRRGATVVGLMLFTLGISACSGMSSSGDGSAGTGTGSSPTAPASPEETAGEPPALDLWDNFGAPEGHEFGRYETLHAMVRGGHAVIGGTVGGVDDGIVLDQDDPELLGVRITLKVTDV